MAPALTRDRTVLVCDDSRRIREALSMVIGGLPRFRPVGAAVDGASCLNLLAATAPDILVLDVNLPGGGASLVRAARSACPATRIVMHSGRFDVSTRLAMLAAGADAYVVKSGRISRLIQAMDGPSPVSDGSWTRDLSHTAHFFPDDDEWTAELVRYSRTALADGGRLVVVATGPHRAALDTVLSDTLTLAREQGRVRMYCAEETMQRLIPRGRINEGYFRHELRPEVEEFIAGPPDVSLWREMVGLAWGAGDVPGAVKMEALWNNMAVESPVGTKCPYPATTDRPVTAADLAAVRRAHTRTIDPLHP